MNSKIQNSKIAKVTTRKKQQKKKQDKNNRKQNNNNNKSNIYIYTKEFTFGA